jgi:hypothetical protein
MASARRSIMTAVAAVSFAAGGTMAAQPASAQDTLCNTQGTKTSTSTRATTASCNGVQARIDRYYNSQVYIYTGPWSSSSSYVSASQGVNAGNAHRGRACSGCAGGRWFWI